MVVMPSRRCRSFISLRRWARTLASSADSGSSSSSRPGDVASARASAIAAAGRRRAGPGTSAPDRRGRPGRAARAPAYRARRGGRAGWTGHSRRSWRRSGWETARRTGRRCRNRAGPAAAGRCPGRPARSGPGLRVEPSDGAQQGGLAAAGRPEKADELALDDVERDVAQRLEGAKRLADPFDPQVGCAASRLTGRPPSVRRHRFALPALRQRPRTGGGRSRPAARGCAVPLTSWPRTSSCSACSTRRGSARGSPPPRRSRCS